MNPALTTIQNDVRAADLRERAARRRNVPVRKSSRDQQIERKRAGAAAPAFAPLALVHGFFGREHGSHA